MPTTPRQTLTFISRSAPYGSDRPRLCLDMALAAAVFEQTVNYVFLDDGVYQLLDGQNAEAIRSKTLGKALETLDLYGIDNVYVARSALTERQLIIDDLLLAATPLDDAGLRELLADSDCVFNL